MTLRIRPALPTDADFLARGNGAMAFETEHKHLDPAVVAAGVRAALADPAKGRYFVAERDGVPVGQLMITYEWSDWRDGTFWWIQSVYVVPEARRDGIFRALYRHLEQLAAQDPAVCGIRLYVERENSRAQAAYRHCGMGDAGYVVMETIFTRAAIAAGGEHDAG